jgi:hypothetical protein
MNSKVWFRKALSMCLMVAIYATYSMVVLASPDKIVGELTVAGKSVNGEIPLVTVNGEAVRSGRSIFSASTIATTENSGAVVNVGKSGKIELAPNTVVTLSFNEKGLSGDLSSGAVTALSADNVSVKLPNGEVLKLKAGETATTGQQTQTQTQTSSGGAAWWVYALILGGAVAGIALAATSDSNDLEVGGGSIVVSPR